MKSWHKEDIFAAFLKAGWQEPIANENDCFFVGESYRIQKNHTVLTLSFVSDVGIGYQGVKSIEEVIAMTETGDRYELWLMRRRDNKWHNALATWIKELEK